MYEKKYWVLLCRLYRPAHTPRRAAPRPWRATTCDSGRCGCAALLRRSRLYLLDAAQGSLRLRPAFEFAPGAIGAPRVARTMACRADGRQELNHGMCARAGLRHKLRRCGVPRPPTSSTCPSRFQRPCRARAANPPCQRYPWSLAVAAAAHIGSSPSLPPPLPSSPPSPRPSHCPMAHGSP
jgi:hypothetical protein